MPDAGLKIGEIVSNRRLMDIFHCACEGGIRYSSKTETVVVVINNTKDGRPNRENEGRLFFAGRPFKHGETFEGANKRLENFLREGKPVFVFQVDEPGKYQYRGRAAASGVPEIAIDNSGEKYPVFPMKLRRD